MRKPDPRPASPSEHRLFPSALAAPAILLASFLAGGCTGDDEASSSSTSSLTDEAAVEGADGDIPNNLPFPNPAGFSASFSAAGSVDLDDPFFQDFGTNQRTCESCHFIENGWGVSAARVEQLFRQTGGTHPIFRPVDGANSPLADVSTRAARRAAYSMLRTRGVIRIGIAAPAEAEFELVAVDDPYGFASADELSLFRRPLPSAGVAFVIDVMWDGREDENGDTLDEQLAAQADNATIGHAEAAQPLSETDRQAMVDFQKALMNAQLIDRLAGRLDADGARGGPEALVGSVPTPPTPDNPARFDLFDAWIGIDEIEGGSRQAARRAAIARGQELFNTRVNNPNERGVISTCVACHNVTNVGGHISPAGPAPGPGNTSVGFFNTGVSDGARRTPDLPLYTLRNKANGDVLTTTDPGRALITGFWLDVDRFKVPNLRGLASRAPFFHNGSAATLAEVVTFYEEELAFDFTPDEEADLVAFMTAL
jgi:cytochrome c peroxidase